MAIDVVYPLGKGSRWKNNEIKYSLRSVEKHLQNYGKVFVIGEKPNFLANVNHIPAEDKHPIPDSNIFEKLKTACETKEISDTFLFFNDDHYLLEDFDAEKFPYFYHGTMAEYIKKRGK